MQCLRSNLLFGLLFFILSTMGSSQYLGKTAYGFSQQTPNYIEAETNLQKIILDIVEAYNQQDENRLNHYVNKEYPVAFIFRRGAVDNISFHDSIQFNQPTPEYLAYSPIVPNNYNIQFGVLPEFSCETGKWNRPSGIYCDLLGIDSLRSITMKNEKKYDLRDWSPQVITKLEALEKVSVKTIVIDSYGAAFIFYLSKKNRTWHLTGIDRFEVCDA